jgi:hypothetical protein
MKQKFTKVKLLESLSCCLLILGSCVTSCSSSNSTPEGLAKECCECYQEMRTLKNPDGRDRKLAECADLQMDNQRKLYELGMDNDWNDEQVKDARNRFENILDKCFN